MLPETSLMFRDELNPGERLLWSGQPQQGFMLRPSDIIYIPFSLLWGGFAIFWEFMAITHGAPFLFRLWGIPFVLVGLYMIFGRFLVDIFVRTKTYYSLTNERALILSGLFNRNLRSINLKTSTDINISTKDDGKGTITFGPTGPLVWLNSMGARYSSQRYQPPAFEGIENAQVVFRQIQQVQQELT